jgi:hypothetical protein
MEIGLSEVTSWMRARELREQRRSQLERNERRGAETYVRLSRTFGRPS